HQRNRISQSHESTRTEEITKEGSQMVEDLRRLGGEAGVIAGLALGWLLLGVLVVWPSAGLSFAAEFNPNRILPFVHRHEVMFWAVNILGGLLAAVMSIILYLAAGDRFTNEAPARARIGAVCCVCVSYGCAACEMMWRSRM